MNCDNFKLIASTFINIIDIIDPLSMGLGFCEIMLIGSYFLDLTEDDNGKSNVDTTKNKKESYKIKESNICPKINQCESMINIDTIDNKNINDKNINDKTEQNNISQNYEALYSELQNLENDIKINKELILKTLEKVDMALHSNK